MARARSEDFFHDLLGGGREGPGRGGLGAEALGSEAEDFFEQLIGRAPAPSRPSIVRAESINLPPWSPSARLTRAESINLPPWAPSTGLARGGAPESWPTYEAGELATEDDPPVTEWRNHATTYSTLDPAIAQARVLQQTHIEVAVSLGDDGKWKIRYRYPLPTGTPPFWDNVYYHQAPNAERRAKQLAAYSYTVTIERLATQPHRCKITAAILSKPRLPTALGRDIIMFRSEAGAKARVDSLGTMGFSAVVEGLVDGWWRVRITALPTFGATMAPVATPTHKLEQVSSTDPAKKKLSDAVVQSFRDWAKAVKDLTDVSIDTGFGDTVRPLGSTTTKKGADTVSWHKTGRAADLNQGLKWIIVEDPQGTDLYFRLYLKHKDATAAENAPTVVKFPKGTKTHHGTFKADEPYVDVTQLASQHGWARIKAHDDWKTNYNGREWWHYEKRGGLTWFQAIREIYTEAETVAGLKTFAGTADGAAKWGDRLVREGVDESTLKQVLPTITRGSVTLLRGVGEGDKAVNFPGDTKAVQGALIKAGKLTAGADTGTIDAATIQAIKDFQTSIGIAKPDGVVTPGSKTHVELGKK